MRWMSSWVAITNSETLHYVPMEDIVVDTPDRQHGIDFD
jgi:hypothetical protein